MVPDKAFAAAVYGRGAALRRAFCGGEHAVCLGCDLDGIESTPDGIDGIRDLPKLADSLVSLGASAETVERVFYRNAQEFFDRNGLEPLGDRELRYAATTLPPSLGSLI